MPPGLKRRFLQVGSRRVHYLRAGDGPPAVLVHSSPANAWLLMGEIESLSRDYTVFAFDTPGFGLSQPLAADTVTVADLADALAETLAAIGMPPCPIYGSHSGAAIALELGARHPERLTGLVLDGVPAFTADECQALFGDYFRRLPVTDLGGQYAEAWTRFRDQSVWFPWSHREPEALNEYDLSPAERTHLWVSMYFAAAETYAPAYRAALFHGEGVLAAARALTLPAIYTASDTDMLRPHLDRLPALNPGQELRRFGVSLAAKFELIAEGFARFGSPGAAPADRDGVDSAPGVARQFLDLANGAQAHLRYAGDRQAPPLLLLHDAPGSAAALEPLIEALAGTHFVVAPDLPGAGESDAFPEGAATIADYAAAMTVVLDRLGLERVRVVGVGFGSSAAVELARAYPERVEDLALCGLLAPDSLERAALVEHYAPRISIEPDGSHWYRTWLMLRDSLVWWPWYDRRRAALRRTPQDFDPRRLHQWTVDVMRRHESYGQPIRAALAHDAEAGLSGLTCPVVRLDYAATPLSVYDSGAAPAPGLTGDPLIDAAVLTTAFDQISHPPS